MSDEPNSKRRKMNRKNTYQQSYNKAKNFLEPGISGFFATCNYGEKECVRECYNLLNEYADQLALERENEKSQVKHEAANDDGAMAAAKEVEQGDSKQSGNGGDDDDEKEEEDISTLLQKEINTINANKRDNRYRFQQVETNVSNCIFIKTTLPNANELGVRIVRDIAETKKRKTRMLLRFWPVDAVCRANVNEIKNAAGQLFDKVFLNAEPTTYSIAFNKRHNNSLDRMEIIQELANMVDFKNSAHKVDLKTPKITVVVEVIKGLCCISLLPDYFKMRKYNVHELTQDDKEKADAAKQEKSNDENKQDSVDTVVVKAADVKDDAAETAPAAPEAPAIEADNDVKKSNAEDDKQAADDSQQS